MSGNAALAAARRRRGDDHVNNFQSNSNINNIVKQENLSKSSIHPLQCILEHDKQLFVLERKLEKLEEDTKNKEEPSSTELDIMTQNNSNEIKLLKNNLQKQQKSIQELNSLVTSLRASISNQEKIIEDLSDLTKSLNVKENDDTKTTVKLDISD